MAAAACAALAGCGGGRVAEGRGAVILAAGGDVMLDRGVAREIAARGTDWPFGGVRRILSRADVAFANLECPLSDRQPKLRKPIAFRGPGAAGRWLADAGLDVVSLANNHAVDCGREGLVETMGHLEGAGVRWCGAGRTRGDAETARFITCRGLRVAFVGFSEFSEGAVKRDRVPTIALAEAADVRRSVAAARAAADVVVASFHWGDEYTAGPNEGQRRIATVAAQAGADLLLGHHPHVAQGFAWIPRGGGRSPMLAAYSLGNLVFDQSHPGTRDGVILRVALTRDGVAGAEALPVRIERGRPVPVSAGRARACLALLRERSRPLGAGLDGRRITRLSREETGARAVALGPHPSPAL